MEVVNGGSLGEDKGGAPPPSPLTGCYLLVVIGEPHSKEHKDIILQKVAKGLLSWDVNECLVNLEKELANITEQKLEGEEARNGERLIQFASENLVTEILIHPAVSTLSQCVRNLLSSFTRHRHIIHAGYTFQGNGSWALQDGTFSYSDFSEAFQEIEVQRVIHAYENGISIDLHCTPEGDWARLPKEYFTKSCKVRVNPTDVLTTGSPSISSFTKYLEPFLVPTALEDILESSDVVGNIRFSRPTLYVFPGGQGDAALFGINGFNMLLDGGYSRKACFWDFVRHLDRLDAVLMTRLNNSSVSGVSSILKRKKQGAVYPQVGHFFCNIQERKSPLSPDGDKDKDPLIISLLEEGHSVIQDLRHLNLSPQSCYRDSEPIILYHKVGHGTLNMYVLSPDKNSREVRDFLQKWNQSDCKLFVGAKSGKDFSFPLHNLVSICALLVWQPANPNDTITRILYPGSTPQKKIFEGLDRLKSLEYMKNPICTVKSVAPVKKSKLDVLEKLTIKETKAPVIGEKKTENKMLIEESMKNGEMNGDIIKEKQVKKSDSQESDKEKKGKKVEDVKKIEESRKIEKTEENGKIMENGDKAKSKQKPGENRAKLRGESQQRKKPAVEKKGPPTPKKSNENKINGESKEREKRATHKASPNTTPAKSTKDANNRKVVESKKAPLKRENVPKPAPAAEAKTKPERKPISRRPKAIKGPQSPIKKMANGVQKPDSISKRGKLDKEGTTDSSTVSTPSADQESILKKDISKLTPEEFQQLKDKELEELKEEQDAIKEIEAVFRKGEAHVVDSEPGVRKIKEVSIDDNLETEEYLIIEKEEVDHDSLIHENKEDEMQKLVRDSEESEKQRKLSADENELKFDMQEKKEEIAPKVSEDPDSKKQQIVSPEDKVASTTDKKEFIDEEVKEVAESQPEEKISGNIESGATTTAPTLPEDERITLDEIKEDNGQIIEEKHVKEDTKEKEVPIIQLPPKSHQDSPSKQPPVVGIPLDKQKHVRDIVKTPDEVADLPVHEEADYQEFQGDDKKSNDVEAHKQQQDKEDKKGLQKNEEEETISPKKDDDGAKIEIGKSDKDKEGNDKRQIEPEHEEKENDKKKDIAEQPQATKDTLDKKGAFVEQKQAEIDSKIKDSVIEVVSSLKTDKIEKSDISEKANVERKEKSDQDNNLCLQEQLKETVDDEWVVITKKEETTLETGQEADIILDEKDNIDTKGELGKSEHLQDVCDDAEDELSENDDKKEAHVMESKPTEDELFHFKASTDCQRGNHEIRKEDEIDEIIEKDKEDIIALIEEADKKPMDDHVIDTKVNQRDDEVILDEKVSEIKESKQEISATDSKLQELKKEVTVSMEELKLDKVEKDLTKIGGPLQVDLKQKLKELETIDDKLSELKSIGDKPSSQKEGIKIEKSTRSPEHAESVVLSDSSPEEEEPHILKDLDIDKLELGRKSPAEREEDVKKIVASVAVVLKSEAPLEEFQGKLAFTQELRETHITTLDSPILEAKIIKTDDIPPIPEEPMEDETKLTKTEKKDVLLGTIETVNVSSKDTSDTKENAEDKLDKDDVAGTVHRMLVTTSSEDGGEEIEICPVGTITFSKSSESSGRSSPEPSQKTQSHKSSVVETLPDTPSTVKILAEKGTDVEAINLESKIGEKIEVLDKHVLSDLTQVKSDDENKSSIDILREVSDKTDGEGKTVILGKHEIPEHILQSAMEIASETQNNLVKDHADAKNLKEELENPDATNLIHDDRKEQVDQHNVLLENTKKFIENEKLGRTSSMEADSNEVINKVEQAVPQKGEVYIKPEELAKVAVTVLKDEPIQVSSSLEKIVLQTEKIQEDMTEKTTDSKPNDNTIDDDDIDADILQTLTKHEPSKNLNDDIVGEKQISTDIKENIVEKSITFIDKENKEFEKNIKTVGETFDHVKTDANKKISDSIKTVDETFDHVKTEANRKIGDSLDSFTTTIKKETDELEENLEEIKEKVSNLTSTLTDSPKGSEHQSSEVEDKISDSKHVGGSLPELKQVESKLDERKISDSDEEGVPTTEKRESIIEKAQELITKSEKGCEGVLNSISNKVHSVLDDIIKTESDLIVKDESADLKHLLDNGHPDDSPACSGKSTPESKELKYTVEDVLAKGEQKHEADSISKPQGIKEATDKSEEKENDALKNDLERKGSITIAAEDFIKKSEKTLESVFSTIGEATKSVLQDILPEKEATPDKPSTEKTYDLISKFTDSINLDEFKIDKETIEEKEKDINNQVKDISVGVEKISDNVKKNQAVVEQEIKQLENDIKEYKKLSEDAYELKETVFSDRSRPADEFKVGKDTMEQEKKSVDEKVDQLKQSYENVSKFPESVPSVPFDEYKISKKDGGEHKRSLDDFPKLEEAVALDKRGPAEEFMEETKKKEENQIENEYKVDKDAIIKEENELKNLVTESYEEVSHLAQSISSEKCHPSEEHKPDSNSPDKLEETFIVHSDEFKVNKDAIEKEKKQDNLPTTIELALVDCLDECKVDEKVIQKKEKEIDDQVQHISETVDKMCDLNESVSFEKCHLSDVFKVDKQVIERGEKQIEEEVSQLKETYEDLSMLTRSISFEKCKTTEEFKVDKEILEQDENQIEKEVDHLKKSYEDLSKLTKSISFDKCQPPDEFKVKESVLDSNKVEHLTNADKKDKKEVDVSSEKQGHFANVAETSKQDFKDEIIVTKDSIILDDQPISSQTEKCEKESMEKTSIDKATTSLKVDQAEHKKLSISDVQISINTDIDHKDSSQSFLDNERSAICDSTDAKVYIAPADDLIVQDGSSTVVLQASTEIEASSDKSSSDMELSGKTTPPTVPISPVTKDAKSPPSKLDSGLSEHTETDEEDLSTKSQVAHSQSDLDELDMKMDPMSMSFYGALPEEQIQEPATFLYEITKAKYTGKIKLEEEEDARPKDGTDLMTTGFIGELPSASSETKPSESKEEKSTKDAVDSWGKPLGLPAPTHLYEITKARFSSQSEEIDLMTSSFIGDELPSSSHTQQKGQDPMTTSVYFSESSDSAYDPIASWGKPLGLPSPAPPNNNEKGTPKKERKLPAYVTAKNKLNDDRKRAESPSKLKAKKVNPVYVDLTYVPHHGNHYYSYVDFFKRIRARYYVFSGLEPSRQVYDALLEAKLTWDDKELEVTIIPTYDTDILGYWVAENEELLSKFKIDLAPSASRCTINLQDHETSCSAYRLEF